MAADEKVPPAGDGEQMALPPDGRAPEQRFELPVLQDGQMVGRDATGEYATAMRDDFRGTLQPVLLDIAKGVHEGHARVAEETMDRAISCYQAYFGAMKGATNLTEDGFREAIVAEEERQHRLFLTLRDLLAKLAAEGVPSEILAPAYAYSDPGWDLGFTAGCTISLEGSTYLYACPLVPARTGEYMSLKQAPEVAANIAYLNDDCMVFQQHDQAMSEKAAKAWEKTLGERREITAEVPDVRNAYLVPNYILLDSEREYSDAELVELMDRYQVSAVLMGDSSDFSARIHIDDGKIPLLWREFDR